MIYEQEARTTHDLEGERDSAHSEFETGTLDTITDIYGGTQVHVEATDRHGNVGQEPAISRHDIFGELAGELAGEGIGGERLAGDLGTLSGFSTGAVETVEFFEALLTDPIGTLAAIKDVIGAITELDEIIAALPEAIEQEQERHNPYDADDPDEADLHDSYRQGWYEGYVAYMVVEMAIPAGGAGQALRSSDRLQSAVNTVDQTGDLQRAARYAGQAKHTAGAPVRYTGHHLSRGMSATLDLSREASQRVLSEVPTSGAQYQVGKLLHRYDVDGTDLNRLDTSDQSTVGPTVHRGGDGTTRAIATDGGGEVWRVHQMDLDVNTDALASNLMRHSDEIDVTRVVDDLEALSRNNVEGVDRLAMKLASGDASNVRGTAFEAEVAVRNGANNINELGKPNPHARGEIDVKTHDGRLIEVKSENVRHLSPDDGTYEKIAQQIAHYKNHIEMSEDLSDGTTVEIAIRTEPSDELQSLIDGKQNVELRQY